MIPAKANLASLPHLNDIVFPTVKGASVTLLIGADVPELFCPFSVRRGDRGEPIAIETPLGWSLLGPSLSSSESSNCVVNFIHHRGYSLQKAYDCIWSNEFADGTLVFWKPFSEEDGLMYRLLPDKVTFVNGHYQLPLPWRPGFRVLPNNSHGTATIIMPEKNVSQKNPDLKQKYVETIQSYLADDYVALAPLHEDDSAVWFLPHHVVLHPKKPDKLRVVFDCAAKFKGVCLNDVLMPGPCLTNKLVGVLIRFRMERVALTGDVCSMFHQIRVHPKDTDALRFLWWPSGDLDKNPVDYQMKVHLFGATSSPSCSSFCLRQVVQDFSHLHIPLTLEIVKNNFYVDDCLASFESEDIAINIVHDLRSVAKL